MCIFFFSVEYGLYKVYKSATQMQTSTKVFKKLHVERHKIDAAFLTVGSPATKYIVFRAVSYGLSPFWHDKFNGSQYNVNEYKYLRSNILRHRAYPVSNYYRLDTDRSLFTNKTWFGHEMTVSNLHARNILQETIVLFDRNDLFRKFDYGR